MSILDFVSRYARPPSDTTVGQAVSIHTNVRTLLGDAEYLTFLQGSYKNDTALWDMNDVDIVVVSRGTVSRTFAGGAPSGRTITWDEIFSKIESKLSTVPRYQGKWQREDKCIRLNTGVKVDIVPAVHISSADTDPIVIYSFSHGSERRNWPRQHYDAGTAKSDRTNGAYKQTVRLFKRWAKCWFGSRKVAPSYYIECAIYSQPDAQFSGNLLNDFIAVGTRLCQISPQYNTLPRLAGEGNLFDSSEWGVERFDEFRGTLSNSLTFARASLQSPDEEQARRFWVSAFNGQPPT